MDYSAGWWEGGEKGICGEGVGFVWSKFFSSKREKATVRDILPSLGTVWWVGATLRRGSRSP